jgi:hypothetical protein
MAICGIARGCAKPLSLRNGSVPWNTSGVVTPPKCGLVSLHHHLARIKERWIPGAVSRFGSDRHRRNPAVGRRVGGGPHSVLFRPLLQAPLGVSRCPIADRSRWRSRTTGYKHGRPAVAAADISDLGRGPDGGSGGGVETPTLPIGSHVGAARRRRRPSPVVERPDRGRLTEPITHPRL